MRFIRARDVISMIGVSRTTLWRMVRAGLFPQPVRITKRNTSYIFDDVEGWMRDRAGRTASVTASEESGPSSGAASSMLLFAQGRVRRIDRRATARGRGCRC